MKSRTFATHLAAALVSVVCLNGYAAELDPDPDCEGTVTVIPYDEYEAPLTPRDIAEDSDLVAVLKRRSQDLTDETMRFCIENGREIVRRVIDFDRYAAIWNEVKKAAPATDFPLHIEDSVLWSFGQGRIVTVRRFKQPDGPTNREHGAKAPDEVVSIPDKVEWRNVTVGPAFSVWERSRSKLKPTMLLANLRLAKKTVAFLAPTPVIKFAKDVRFDNTRFPPRSYFHNATFSGYASFRNARFDSDTSFWGATFRRNAQFGWAHFAPQSDTTAGRGRSDTNFPGEQKYSEVSADFDNTKFLEDADFHGTMFRASASFRRAMFQGDADFRNTHFEHDANFARVMVTGHMSLESAEVKCRLKVDNTSFGARMDWRNIRVHELSWDSKVVPSTVTGLFDAGNAIFGRLGVTNVRFFDLANFADARFGGTGSTAPNGPPVCDLGSRSPDVSGGPNARKPGAVFERVIFDQESDFVRTLFVDDAIFVRNRFRKSWNLTDAIFGYTKDTRDQADANRGRLCGSYNRLDKLHMPGPDVSNYRSGWERLFRPMSTLTVLKRSGIRGVMYSKTVNSYVCRDLFQYVDGEEDLSAVYMTVATSFRHAKNRSAENEAWYLGTVSEMEKEYRLANGEVLSVASYWLFRIFGDIPSRFGTDLVRVGVVSVAVVIMFGLLYWCYFDYQVSCTRMEVRVRGRLPAKQARNFRFRPFERYFEMRVETGSRAVQPLRDAMLLSCRTFFKMGLGTTYPAMPWLVRLAHAEWVIGAFVLIHFLLAMKNTLPIGLLFVPLAD